MWHTVLKLSPSLSPGFPAGSTSFFMVLSGSPSQEVCGLMNTHEVSFIPTVAQKNAQLATGGCCPASMVEAAADLGVAFSFLAVGTPPCPALGSGRNGDVLLLSVLFWGGKFKMSFLGKLFGLQPAHAEPAQPAPGDKRGQASLVPDVVKPAGTDATQTMFLKTEPMALDDLCKLGRDMPSLRP
jgi:hypothetical protein